MIDRPDSGGGTGAADEETTIRLLRLAGARAPVHPSRQARVKVAFLEETRAVVRVRVCQRRTMIAAGALAVAAGLVLATRLGSPRLTPIPEHPPVATVERVEGIGGRLVVERAGPIDLGIASAVGAGDWVETGADGRLAVRLAEGQSVRLDRASRVQFLSASALMLAAGGVYVDSGAASTPLEIRTDLANVRDVGTQFEVRLDDSGLHVRVRSGVVEVRRGTRTAYARPGTQLIVDSRGVVSGPFAPYGPAWAWAATLAPPVEIEGQALDLFLQQLCREQGWTLAYADAKLAREASGMILHGSAKGLQSSEVLAAVLATTGLTHQLQEGELRVARQAAR